MNQGAIMTLASLPSHPLLEGENKVEVCSFIIYYSHGTFSANETLSGYIVYVHLTEYVMCSQA